MAGIGAGYDLSVSTFSPDGRVFQVEYAGKAVDNSGTCIGAVCSDGIVFAEEKFVLNKMLMKGTNRRIFAVDKHIGMAVAGLLPDARQILIRAHEECISYKKNYGENIPVQVLAERIGLYVHAYTLYWSVRPFGAAVLLGGINPPPDVYDVKLCGGGENEKSNVGEENYDLKLIEDGVLTGELYCIEPSGTSYKYEGMALGKGKQSAKTELEKLDLKNMKCEEMLFHLCKILNLVHDESKDKDMEIEMSWICKSSNFFYQKVPRSIVEEANQKAIAHIQELENS